VFAHSSFSVFQDRPRSYLFAFSISRASMMGRIQIAKGCVLFHDRRRLIACTKSSLFPSSIVFRPVVS